MNEVDRTRVETFINRWAGSSGNERANYQWESIARSIKAEFPTILTALIKMSKPFTPAGK
ncbi:MAG: hypothetical protein JGK29_20370 [Microcoleus sp. PH2017_17_BER_D_A]|nr:hypothetical protein [Microcoleus sp. PH2017_17_BER_D_A]